MSDRIVMLSAVIEKEDSRMGVWRKIKRSVLVVGVDKHSSEPVEVKPFSLSGWKLPIGLCTSFPLTGCVLCRQTVSLMAPGEGASGHTSQHTLQAP